MKHEIKELIVDFGLPEGSWRATKSENGYGIGGKPFPSESQAWYFREYILPAVQKVVQMSTDELKEFLGKA
jgi:hypothetical protein